MATIVVCVLFADFLTGLFHWVEDTYGVPSWLLVGKPVILPNIDHHRRPQPFTMGSFLMRNIQPLLGVLIVLVAFLLFGLSSWPLALVALLTGFGNEVHTWAHRKHNGPVVTLLQEMGLAQSKAQHAQHHKPPFDGYFCTLTNVCNPVLERLRFWKSLERGLSLLGIHPKRMSPERDGF
jgi:plasmanylethanolamine desaturase